MKLVESRAGHSHKVCRSLLEGHEANAAGCVAQRVEGHIHQPVEGLLTGSFLWKKFVQSEQQIVVFRSDVSAKKVGNLKFTETTLQQALGPHR